jgi:hypothetical protein
MIVNEKKFSAPLFNLYFKELKIMTTRRNQISEKRMGFNQGGSWLIAVLTLGGLCSPVLAGGGSTERDIPASTMSVMASSHANGTRNDADKLLDGKPETCWIADFNDTNPTITLNLGSTVFDTPPAQPVTIAAVRELNASSWQGVSQYDILVSADSTNGRDGTWTHVASGIWMYPILASGAGTEMRAWFHPVAAKYLRLEIRGKEWFKVSKIFVERAGDVPPTFPSRRKRNRGSKFNS